MFTDKHVVVALIVGPVLAILAWLAVGQIAAEKAAVAVPGHSYPLLEKSDCRYPSGHCTLENEDFKLRLQMERRDTQVVLLITSAHALDGVMLSVVTSEQSVPPGAMRSTQANNKEWAYILERVPVPEERIHLVTSHRGSRYFADAATLFIKRPL